jgi:hypothetical protein
MSLELTSLLHLTTLLVPIQCVPASKDIYPKIVILATITSCAWHSTHESVMALTVADMMLATIWGLLDILYAYKFHNWVVLVQVIYLNTVVALIHRFYETQTQKLSRRTYVINHSLWHVLSAAKCVAVALLLQCHPDNICQ